MGSRSPCTSTLRLFLHYGAQSRVSPHPFDVSFSSTPGFIAQHPEHIAPDNAMKFLSDDGGETYNKCHCKFKFTGSGLIDHVKLTRSVWSNFEIGSLTFWRSQAYMDFFEHLDSQGGFYYERWGDAPVHSIGAALFANKSQIHFFDDIGYRHEPFQVSLIPWASS